MFYFPDEKSPPDRNNGKTISQVTNDLGNFTYVSCKGYDTDDEFYIVGNEAGLGVPVSKFATPLKYLFYTFSDQGRFPRNSLANR